MQLIYSSTGPQEQEIIAMSKVTDSDAICLIETFY